MNISEDTQEMPQLRSSASRGTKRRNAERAMKKETYEITEAR